MLSDMTYSTLPFDMPTYPDRIALQEEDPFVPLNFDDLLDIAHEFEFTRTITHIWPCEEESTTNPESPLEDILSAVVTPEAEECSASSITAEPVHLQQVNSTSKCPAPAANACTFTDPVPLRKNDDPEIVLHFAPTLQGWSPPNGSEFLDLDVSLMLPQSTKDMLNSSRLAIFLATQHLGDISQSPATGSPPTTKIDETADIAKKKSVVTSVQPSTHDHPEPVQARSVAQTSSTKAKQMVIAFHAKTTKARFAPGDSVTSNAKHARAPRGGIPPHIARSVTKANILRVEKERKVLQDTFCSTAMGQSKKPSVLRKTFAAEGEISNNAKGGDNGKKHLDWNENGGNQGRATKRAKVSFAVDFVSRG